MPNTQTPKHKQRLEQGQNIRWLETDTSREDQVLADRCLSCTGCSFSKTRQHIMACQEHKNGGICLVPECQALRSPCLSAVSLLPVEARTRYLIRACVSLTGLLDLWRRVKRRSRETSDGTCQWLRDDGLPSLLKSLDRHGKVYCCRTS